MKGDEGKRKKRSRREEDKEGRKSTSSISEINLSGYNWLSLLLERKEGTTLATGIAERARDPLTAPIVIILLSYRQLPNADGE